MSPVFQVVFLAMFVYFLTDYRNFRKKSALQKGWFIALNLLTFCLVIAVMLNYRPPMPTRLITDVLSQRMHHLLEEVAQIEANR
jgi:hypothetical protein